jgi:2-isopropylmalate synthase
LGIGERVGNAAMELILLNLKLLGQWDGDLSKLLAYCESVAGAVDWQVPINYPLVGRDAFRTATGVHAAAIIKAMAKGDHWLADRIEPTETRVNAILAAAKQQTHIMTDTEINAVLATT